VREEGRLDKLIPSSTDIVPLNLFSKNKQIRQFMKKGLELV